MALGSHVLVDRLEHMHLRERACVCLFACAHACIHTCTRAGARMDVPVHEACPRRSEHRETNADAPAHAWVLCRAPASDRACALCRDAPCHATSGRVMPRRVCAVLGHMLRRAKPRHVPRYVCRAAPRPPSTPPPPVRCAAATSAPRAASFTPRWVPCHVCGRAHRPPQQHSQPRAPASFAPRAPGCVCVRA